MVWNSWLQRYHSRIGLFLISVDAKPCPQHVIYGLLGWPSTARLKCVPSSRVFGWFCDVWLWSLYWKPCMITYDNQEDHFSFSSRVYCWDELHESPDSRLRKHILSPVSWSSWGMQFRSKKLLVIIPGLILYPGWWFGTWTLFFHILGRKIPTDFHIFQRGRYTTNQVSVISQLLKTDESPTATLLWSEPGSPWCHFSHGAIQKDHKDFDGRWGAESHHCAEDWPCSVPAVRCSNRSRRILFFRRHGGFLRYPNSWMVYFNLFHGKSQSKNGWKMGYPHFRNHQYIYWRLFKYWLNPWLVLNSQQDNEECVLHWKPLEEWFLF